ncbi:MAG: sulfite exporter TauE/SafE family protein [Deltaproteobacteria bacterium]|nr:sulfite exporter TauE/SafE family protein [Deltaproteobacteria bacterium]
MSPWAHLLSVGVVWITLHCAGMCGPIVLGLDVAGAARGLRPMRGVSRILAYQAGRMTTLGVLGLVAGLAGRGLGAAFASAGAALAITFGATIVALAIARLLPKRPAPARPMLSIEAGGRRPSGWSPLSWVRSLSLSSSHGSAWLIGVVLGFLPCMIVVWALGLAAVSGSPLEGAAIMVTLVAMTTPMLLGVTLLPRLVPRRALAILPQALMAVSGAWMILVGLAGLEVVPHVHIPAGEFTIMLW